MIKSPLQRCQPAEMPKKTRLTPAGLSRIVLKGREKTKQWQAGQRM
jgi:hypothetical protein